MKRLVPLAIASLLGLLSVPLPTGADPEPSPPAPLGSDRPVGHDPVVPERMIEDGIEGALLKFRDARTGEIVGETREVAAADRSPSPAVPVEGTDAGEPDAGEEALPQPDTIQPDSYYDRNGDGFVDYATPEGMCARTDVATARYHDAVDSPTCP